MKRCVFVFCIVLYVASCAKVATDDGKSRIIIDAVIEESSSVRSIQTGTDFKENSTIGVFVYLAEDAVPPVELNTYGEKYGNIRARIDVNKKWTYRFKESTTTFDDIYLINPVTTDKGLTICAYSPWIEETESITDIPFVLGGAAADVKDLMWAEQNSDGTNAGIKPDGVSKTIPLTFHHSLAQIRCCFKCKYDKTEMTVSSVTLAKNPDGTTPFYVGGYFNALNGTFSDLTPGSSFTTEYKNIYFDSSGYSELSTASLLMIPVDDYKADGDYVLKFKLDGQNIESEYPIARNDIRTGSEGSYRYGFEAGKTYTFYFTFNNYIQLDNVVVSSDSWTAGSDIKLEF